MKKQTTQKIALTGLMAALSYVVFTFYRLRSLFPEEMQPPSTLETPSAFLALYCSAVFTAAWEALSA